MITTNEAQALLDGGQVLGHDGTKIGKVGQIYLDDRTNQPEWVTVKTGLFGQAESFAPLAQATVEGDEVRIPYGKDMVKDAPRMEDAEGHLSLEQEADLYRYYGMDYSESGPDSGLLRGAEHGAATASGAESRASGKARLRKYVVTENVTDEEQIEADGVDDPRTGR